ncbi:TGF-beta-activated kinase 1 and MAP3K7-binding protein 1-like [Stegodyphus dumicola]|uniref:TGF-beta-activated kinase 1 and MAP3K7-binding protein 1-like n=1 Tax=Stegodyphus dumicola TaxID=202533 RepID=UPI0015AE2C20|nr:TGF-beta-activated kinase 1 and MAP3K7-binding protein 1-like [Stegodyphus dumicola]
MPTKAEFDDLASNMADLRLCLQEPCHSWTDDLPYCPLSGVGFATNQKYRVDGFRREEHAFEDKSFHFRYDEDTYFYGVFDGHVGTRAADFAAQRMPAEILLGQLKGKENDYDVREVLHQAFLAVEKSFFESIDDLLAEKEKLRLQLQGLRTIEAISQFPDVVQRLKLVTEEIQSGTTAVVALILKNKLYIANVGDCRAVLCKEDKDGKTCICQLSSDHTFTNEDELLRMSHIGVDISKLKQESKVGLLNHTRCIGNYTVKGGYKEFDNFSEAEEEPIIAEPNIVGGIKIDEKCKFLLLMSDGLYRSLEEATGAVNANAVLVNILLEQFAEQSTLNGVAQAVVDKVVRIHHDAFMQDTRTPKRCQNRDDITLLVRNFNYPLRNAHTSSPSISNQIPVVNEQKKQNISENNTLSDVRSLESSYVKSSHESETQSIFMNDGTSLTTSSESGPQLLFQSANNISLDEDGRVKPYVDFSDFFAAVEEAYKAGLVPEDWLRPNS